MVQNRINAKNCFVQFVSNSSNTGANLSTVTPADDSIPQNNEGDEVLTVSITPKFSTSTLEIYFTTMAVKTTTGFLTCALFQDTTANALAAKSFSMTNASSNMVSLQYIMTSGTTSSTTFKIRIGPSTGTVAVNSTGSTLGGTFISYLTVLEHL